ncbi:DUF1684 domain-containing protein [Actinoplanes sp. NPDC089786]|uniref:DUF1684 domain-containing protein n=1 Tax=Actinoplanes sp. NPDC089786 TaxID=3155185 RepID=UPI00342B56D6
MSTAPGNDVESRRAAVGAVDDFVAGWKEWKAGRDGFLAQPFSWLSAVDTIWLDRAPQQYPGVPGEWWQGDGVAYVDTLGQAMTYEGEEFTGVRSFDMAGNAGEIRVTAGRVQIGISYRQDYMIILYDPDSEARAEFTGVPAYQPDPAWVLTGHFEPAAAGSKTRLETVGWQDFDYDSYGRVHLTLAGKQYSFVAMPHPMGGMTTVFTDGTSGVTTYPACRSLDFPAPDDDGNVVLDFNRAANLPCAFYDNPVCPIPPPESRLEVAVEAGEKTPQRRAG